MTKLAIIKLDEKVLSSIPNNDIIKALRRTQKKQITNYENNEMQELVKYLLKMAKFLGISEPPDIDMLQMLGQFIKDHWGHYTIDEINASIYLAITDNEINHFNKLTPQFLNKTFTKYKEKRQKAIFTYRKQFESLYD